MVRNIDLPEALILYGRDVLFMDQLEDSVRPGLSELVQECHQVETKVIVLLLLQHDNQQQQHDDDERKIISLLLPRIDNSNSKKNKNNNNPTITVVRVPHDAVDNDNDAAAATCAVVVANPAALCYAVSRVRVRERPFGGSSGFGRTPVDSSWRAPVPARCVVLVSRSTPQGPRQARAAGMRVLQIHPCVDDPLADGAVDAVLDLGVDDIATPGSFWLNPPHPRDDHGNRVDPEALIAAAAAKARAATVKATDDNAGAGEVFNGIYDDLVDEDVDEDWNAILADLAPLK